MSLKVSERSDGEPAVPPMLRSPPALPLRRPTAQALALLPVLQPFGETREVALLFSTVGSVGETPSTEADKSIPS